MILELKDHQTHPPAPVSLRSTHLHSGSPKKQKRSISLPTASAITCLGPSNSKSSKTQAQSRSSSVSLPQVQLGSSGPSPESLPSQNKPGDRWTSQCDRGTWICLRNLDKVKHIPRKGIWPYGETHHLKVPQNRYLTDLRVAGHLRSHQNLGLVLLHEALQRSPSLQALLLVLEGRAIDLTVTYWWAHAMKVRRNCTLKGTTSRLLSTPQCQQRRCR